MKKVVLVVFAVVGMTGCRLGPEYQYPTANTPDDWKASVKEEDAVSEDAAIEFWWQVFGDDTLNQLECYAVNNNPTLDISVGRVKEALAMAKVTQAQLAPQVAINPQFLDYGQLFQFFVPPGLSPLITTNSIPPFRIHQYQLVLPLMVNYEIDVWGKLHNQADSARYNVEASVFDYEVTMLTLTSNVASTYYQIRMLDAQIGILERTVQWRKTELSLVESRYNAGLVNFQDVSNAQLQLANTQQTYLDALRQRNNLENILATFVGIPASEFCLPRNPLENDPPVIPPGTPSEIMLKRPDIRMAERMAASEHALIGAAYASFFPSLSLQALLGFSSPTLADFMTWKSRYWQLGANSNQTVFDGGINCGNLEAAWANFEQASAQYQQTVLTAFQEVEQALNDIDYEQKQYATLLEAVRAARITATLSENRYKKGLVNYLDVSVNDLNALNAELAAMNMLGMRYVATIQLIKAIGGSWSLEPTSKEPTCPCECSSGDDNHRPGIAPDNVGGNVF